MAQIKGGPEDHRGNSGQRFAQGDRRAVPLAGIGCGASRLQAEYRAELILLIDDAAQVHARRLARDYLSAPRLSKFRKAPVERHP